MIRSAWLALMSHWRRHPLQLLTLLTGLALATGLWSAVQAINAEARAGYDAANDQISAGQLPVLRDPAGPIQMSTYVALRRAGWQVSAVLEGSIRIDGQALRVTGVDLLSHPALPAVAERAQVIAPLEALSAPGIAFARPRVAALLGERPGWPRIEVSSLVPPGVILTDIGVAETLLSMPGQITRLVILPDQPRGVPPLAEIAPDLQRLDPERPIDTAALTNSFHLNLTAFGLLAFAVGLFIVHGTVGLAHQQRRGMIRTLRALGLPMRALTGLLLCELLVVALLGGGAGLVLGYIAAGALLPGVAATLEGLYRAPVEGTLSLRPGWLVSGLAMAVAGTVAASSQALWKTAQLPLLAAPGQQAWSAGAGRANRWLTAVGLTLVAAGTGATAALDGLVGGFALLAGLLTGAALLLPPLLSLMLRIGQRLARAPVSQWVWSDLRAQVPGLSLALMALLLALAANVGVGTMVSSFRLTFIGWLDQRLSADLYLTARDDIRGGELATWLASRSDAVLPIRFVEIDRNGAPLFLYGVVEDQSYRRNWPLIASGDAVWDRVARGEAVLINEQLARRDNLWPGDMVGLQPGWNLEVGGVYSDYGNPTGQAIVALPELAARFDDLPNRRFGVRIGADRIAALKRDLVDDFGLDPDAMIDQQALKAQSMQVFETTFVVTGALNILTLAVAAFAMLTSLLTLWAQRLPQVAPVWAMGLTRRRLGWLELLRSLALAALTAMLALPLGLGLAWVLLAVINVEAFGWRLPMFLFPLDWLRLLGLALLAAGVAAYLPARRMAKGPPGDLLRVFANER